MVHRVAQNRKASNGVKVSGNTTSVPKFKLRMHVATLPVFFVSRHTSCFWTVKFVNAWSPGRCLNSEKILIISDRKICRRAPTFNVISAPLRDATTEWWNWKCSKMFLPLNGDTINRRDEIWHVGLSVTVNQRYTASCQIWPLSAKEAGG